jgi:division protein CdvB (Snf7/Vps24/ESCRT-III family)
MFNGFDNWTKEKKTPLLRKVKKWFVPKKSTFKENMNIAIYHLKASSDKLRRNSSALNRKNQRLFQKCIEYKQNNMPERATLYANECAELKRLAHHVLGSELALEQAIVRLETINELSDVMGSVLPIISIVENTKDRLVSVIPSVSERLGEVTQMIQSSIVEMGSTPHLSSSQSNLPFEAKKILEQANSVAGERIREKFPELPTELSTTTSSPIKIPVALTATGESVSLGSQSIKSNVYNYIKNHNGELSVLQCASYLGVIPTAVEHAILQLQDEGKILLE